MREAPDTYMDLGRKAALARNQNDEVLAAHYESKYTRALGREQQGHDHRQATILFQESFAAYRTGGYC